MFFCTIYKKNIQKEIIQMNALLFRFYIDRYNKEWTDVTGGKNYVKVI